MEKEDETLEELVELNKNDLYSKALEYGIEVNYQRSTKAELAEAIIAVRDGDADQDATGGAVVASDGTGDNGGTEGTPDNKDAAEENTEPAGSDDEGATGAGPDGKVLLYYTGRANTYQIKGLTVGRGRPFVVADEEVADEVLSGPAKDLFRISTPSQAKEFYS